MATNMEKRCEMLRNRMEMEYRNTSTKQDIDQRNHILNADNEIGGMSEEEHVLHEESSCYSIQNGHSEDKGKTSQL